MTGAESGMDGYIINNKDRRGYIIVIRVIAVLIKCLLRGLVVCLGSRDKQLVQVGEHVFV